MLTCYRCGGSYLKEKNEFYCLNCGRPMPQTVPVPLGIPEEIKVGVQKRKPFKDWNRPSTLAEFSEIIRKNQNR